MENLTKRNHVWALCISLIVLSTACAPIQNSRSTDGRPSEDVLGWNSVSQAENTVVAEGEKQDQVQPALEEQNSTQAGETAIDLAQADAQQAVSEGIQQSDQQESDQQTPNDQLAQSPVSGPNQADPLEENDPRREHDPPLMGFSPDGQDAFLSQQENAALTQDDSTPVGAPAQAGTNAISFQQIGDQGSVAGPALSEVEPALPSYLIAGFNLEDYAQFTPANGPANPFGEYSNPRVLGVLNLVKKIRRFDTTIGYKGGALLNQNEGSPLYGHTIQQLVAQERISGTKTSVSFANFLSDGPGATFGSSGSGGSSASNLGSGGGTGTSDYYGTNDYDGFRAQHLNESAIGQVRYMLSSRANLMFVGAFSTMHYFRANAINSQQTTALGGYNYELTQKSQLGVSYGYQYWSYPGSAATSANSIQLNYLHDLSPRLRVAVAAGPQFVSAHSTLEVILGQTAIPVPITSHQEGYTAGGSLSYNLSDKQGISAYYQHLVTSGSGLFQGASTDVSELTGTRNFLGRFATNFSAGFTRLSNLQQNSPSAIVRSTYQYWFASAGMLKPIGRHWSIFAGYQFNDQTATSGCAVASACGSTLHSVMFTLTWRSFPIGLGRGSSENNPIETPPTVPNPSVGPMFPGPDRRTVGTQNYR